MFERSNITVMQHTINPDKIILAREARGLTQSELAQKLHTYKAAISRIENGDAIPDEELLGNIAEALMYPPAFFYQPGCIHPLNLAYRKRQNVPVKLISPIEAQINIIRQQVQFITRAWEKQNPPLPLFKVDAEKNTPAKIAQALRRKWNIDAGPVNNLSKIIEQQGIIICSFDFGTERVDSRSMLTDDKYPIIFLNKNMPGDRQRFSLAFELGHLLMHTYTLVPHTTDINHEANLFAAELLMPEKDIRKDFKENITLPLLGELKRKWKASMIALLYRADDLGYLTPNQKRYLVQQFNQQKIRRREPQELAIPPEKPQQMRQLLAKYMQKTKLGVSQLAAILHIYVDDYVHYYGD